MEKLQARAGAEELVREIARVEAARLLFAPHRLAYVHVARGRATVNGSELAAGDALKTDASAIEVSKGKEAEVLLFDLPAGQ